MEAVADLVARHALLVLFGATFALLMASAVFWRLVQSLCTCVLARRPTTSSEACVRRLALRWREPGTFRLLGRWLASTLTGARFLGVFAILAFAFAAGAVALFFELSG